MPDDPKSLDYQALFQDWEIQLVESMARKFFDPKRLAGMNLEDIKQELFLKLWQEKDAYCPDHASSAAPKTFFYRVLYRRALNLLRDAKRKKRVVHSLVESWVEENQDTTEEPLLDQRLEDKTSRKTQKLDEFRADLERTLRDLSPEHAAICELHMSGLSLTAIAEELGIHRDTLYERVYKLRQVFYQAGLEAYLQPDPTFAKKRVYKLSEDD